MNEKTWALQVRVAALTFALCVVMLAAVLIGVARDIRIVLIVGYVIGWQVRGLVEHRILKGRAPSS